jgi:hypothetical protein
MTITTNEFGQQNMFAKEPEMYIDPKITTQMEEKTYVPYAVRAEMLNGRMSMIGIMAALLNYASTGQIIPGIW